MTEPRADSPKPRHSRSRTLLEYAVTVVVAIVIALAVQAYIVKPYRVPTPSMANTVRAGDRVLIDRVLYGHRDIERGDIVVFRGGPAVDNQVLLKRVVGTARRRALDRGRPPDGERRARRRRVRAPHGRGPGADAAGSGRTGRAVVAADAVRGARRLLLRARRQPHRQLRQPLLGTGARARRSSAGRWPSTGPSPASAPCSSARRGRPALSRVPAAPGRPRRSRSSAPSRAGR